MSSASSLATFYSLTQWDEKQIFVCVYGCACVRVGVGVWERGRELTNGGVTSSINLYIFIKSETSSFATYDRPILILETLFVLWQSQLQYQKARP